MMRSISLYASLVFLIVLISCSGSGPFDLGSNDTATLTLHRIDYSESPPRPYVETTTYEEKDSRTAPMGYDPYLYADVDTVGPDDMRIKVYSTYAGGWQRELNLMLDDIVERTYTIGTDARGSYREGSNTYSFTSGTIVITQIGGLGGYVKGRLNVTLSCPPVPQCPIDTSHPLSGSFTVTRAI